MMLSVVDEVIGVPDDEAIRAGRELAATEGLLAGISSVALCMPPVNCHNVRNLRTKK